MKTSSQPSHLFRSQLFAAATTFQGLFVPKKLEVISEQSRVEMIKWQGNLHIIVSSRMTLKDVWKRVER